MPEPVPALVKPELLIWARESAGFAGLDRVSELAGIEVMTLQRWESGQASPDLDQLRKLGEVYHRSLAVFFLAEPPPSPDVRWRQRLENFGRAFRRLRDAATLAGQRPLTELEQQGLIQAFEFTHELAWNTLKDYLTAHASTARLHGSRDATREAFALGLIADGEAWMRMIEHRNQTTHTYDEQTANEIAEAILTRYVPEFARFQERFTSLEAGGG